MGWVDGGDGGRGTTPWLQPGERVLWRGRPDAGRVFAPADALLVPVTVVWTGFFVAFGVGTDGFGTVPGTVFTSVFLLVGLYLLVGRFVVKMWSRNRTDYVVTDRRAVVTDRGRPRKEVALTRPPVVRRSRDRRRGTVIWAIPPPGVADYGPPPTTHQPMMADVLRGTGWPLADRYLAGELAFVDVVGIDGVASALRAAGCASPVETPGRRSGLAGLRPQPLPPARRGTAGPTTGRSGGPLRPLRHWVRTRLLREPYALWSPLPPWEVTRRLAGNLAPERQFSLGFSGRAPGFRGSATERSVRMSNRGAMGNNSWRFVFDGAAVPGPPGTWLTGTVGPVSFAPVFSAVWCTGVGLFLVAGLVGTVSDLVSGKGFGLLPLLLVPLVMLTFFVVITEVGARYAMAEWNGMDRWLRWLLEVPGPPPGAPGSPTAPV